MNQVAQARINRTRQIGFRTLAEKARVRCWSTRVAIIVSRDTEPTASRPSKLPLTFSVIPSTELDEREFPPSTRSGADLLYIDGLLRVYGHAPGDAIVGRTSDGKLVVVGLMSDAARYGALEEAAPGLYLKPQADECWTEAHYVMPEYRNQGVMAATLAAERAHLRERGILKVKAVIDSENAPSLRAFARERYDPTGTVRRDQYRLNRFTAEFTDMDDQTRERWRAATTRKS